DNIVNIEEDITNQKLAENRIRQIRKFTDHLIKNANVMIIGLDKEGRVTHFNPAAEKITGYELSEIEGKGCFALLTPKDRYPEVYEEFQRLLKGGMPKQFENHILTKSGEERFVSWVNSEISHDGAVTGTISFGLDITEKKQAEQKLRDYQQRLKALASQLTIAEESERRRIATELHDHVGQSLAFARIQLSQARKSTSLEKRNTMLDDTSETLLHTIQGTKNLIFELSAPSMNELGLGAAILEWLEDYIGRRYGLKTEFIDEIDDSLRKTLDDHVRAILFRNVRELLANVVKHAHANWVRVSMAQAEGSMRIVVQDDGVGFNAREISRTAGMKGSYGLFSVEEHMTNLGGSLEIVSEPGKGCKAILMVPLSEGQG
ncbi:MAG TPA: PAS domain S-box protein, partial [Desulfobacterales bacterium]|nr:PAS domain S-box protein [Desulfobacterales bacterium]